MRIDEYFSEQKIEFYGVLDYKDVRETYSALMERAGFTPRSVIIYVLPYYTGETVNISRYAASLDYHIAIKELGEGIVSALSEDFTDFNARGYGDHSPIDERDAAIKAGLGILGKNGLVINEKYGSYIFIGDIITDIPPECLSAKEPLEYRFCHGCGACLRACPTGVLRGESPECLSAITQKKGELSEWEIALIREYNTVWGCDLCQSSCPFNSSPLMTPVEFFYRDRIECLTEEMLSDMDKETFEKRAFAWRKRKTVERNLSIFKEDNAN